MPRPKQEIAHRPVSSPAQPPEAGASPGGPKFTGTRALPRASMAALTLAFTLVAAGWSVAQDWRYYPAGRDDYRYTRDDDWGSLRVAHDFGWADGSSVAREDMYRRKPLNPFPRGKYANQDHGYRHQFGDKYSYEAEYARAYREGYERTYR